MSPAAAHPERQAANTRRHRQQHTRVGAAAKDGAKRLTNPMKLQGERTGNGFAIW